MGARAHGEEEEGSVQPLAKQQPNWWEELQAIHHEQRRTTYGSAGAAELVKPDVKEQIVGILLEETEFGLKVRRERLSEETDNLAMFREVSRDVLREWFRNPGRDGFLANRKHPLYVLAGDLTELAWAWRRTYPDRLEKQRREAVRKKPRISSTGTASRKAGR
ncbi:Hypothetical protein CAP_7678 [Chondromyces apiculatus DSM 436]|uniref:Uncharacterized protein n=1 Tax=Chondromyces apiculatus DSM 436 TaxID=1192034 RepID=A0A017SZ68_9BACT|nr:Hypothetical protein CAP_7678 [Chondromyces apiculatus DSM 436]